VIVDEKYLLRASEANESTPEEATSLSWLFLLGIAALTMLVRVAYMMVFESWNFKDEWAFGYEMGRIGQWLAQGKGVTLDGSSPTAKFPPFYPLIVGGIFYLFGSFTKAAAVSLFVFQSVCSALIAVCLANLGSRLLGRTTGIIAGLIWAFYPASIFYSVVRIWYCELALLLVLSVTMIAVTTGFSPTFRRIAIMGALSGLTVLTDSTMVIYLPLLLIWMLFARRVQWPRLIGLVAVWTITAGVVTGPWIVRNWLQLGSPVLLKSNLGSELLFGTETDGRRKIFRELDQTELEYYRGQSELAYNRYLRSQALERIRENPIGFLSATAKRFGQFWVINPKVGSESFLRLAYFGPLLLLALYGIYVSRKFRWQLGPLWLFLLIYPLPYYVMHVDHGRYSYPVEPFVVLLAAASLAAWAARYSAPDTALETIAKIKLQAENS
jgi:4-amino-4-deoxy-L-arabinose transferase-like glycosyltransferase